MDGASEVIICLVFIAKLSIVMFNFFGDVHSSISDSEPKYTAMILGKLY